jgi:DNA-binding NarL/FixJ family response regulator
VKLRVHVAVADPAIRRRLTLLFRTDPEIVLVGDPEEADLVVDGPADGPTGGLPRLDLEAESPITPRELEVLRLVAHGLDNKTIGQELAISTHTVKYHVASLLAKLGVRSRTEAVAQAIRRGLVPL